jgi:hypothetical protein
MRTSMCLLAGFFAAVGLVTTTSAGAEVHVPIGSLTNDDLRTWTHGDNYPVAPTDLTVGGVSFELVPLGVEPNSLGIVSDATASGVFTFSTNIAAPTTVYTLMNSNFGAFGSNIATLEFKGAGGAFASFDLIEGVNIRDHCNAWFCNSIADGTPSASFGGDVRLDRQTFVLPSSFANDTLTQINFIGHGDLTGSGGMAFLAAMTVATSVPEPSSFALLGIGGCGLLAYAWRKRRLA